MHAGSPLVLVRDYDFDLNGNPLGAVVDAQDRLTAFQGQWDARPALVKGHGAETLFLSSLGEKITTHHMTKMCRGYILKADIATSGSPAPAISGATARPRPCWRPAWACATCKSSSGTPI